MDQSSLRGAVLAVDEIDRDWRQLIDMGPRFPGTPNNDATIAYLSERLADLSYRVWAHEFGYLGWALDAPPTLFVEEPESSVVDSEAFVYCGPTPAEGVRGELEYVGEHWVSGLLRWPKFAIRDSEGKVAGYLSGRTDGPAIPQPLSERSSLVPHFIVGQDDLQRLLHWTAASRRIVVGGTIYSRLNPRARMRNLIASSLPADSDEPRIGLCAHLDSMYTCPGANNNGSGLSALLALARHYAAHPAAVPLEFIFFNGKEWDLAGSKAFVARHVKPSQAARYKLLLNLDGISETVNGMQLWVGPEGFAQELKEAVDDFGWQGSMSGPMSKEYKFPPPLGGDHVPFYNVGVPTCMFTGHDTKKYHLPTDVYWPGGIDSICYVAELTRHLIDHFAGRDTRYASRETLFGAKPYFWSALEDDT